MRALLYALTGFTYYLLIFSHSEEDRPIPLLRGSLIIMVKKRLTRDSKRFLVDFIRYYIDFEAC